MGIIIAMQRFSLLVLVLLLLPVVTGQNTCSLSDQIEQQTQNETESDENIARRIGEILFTQVMQHDSSPQQLMLIWGTKYLKDSMLEKFCDLYKTCTALFGTNKDKTTLPHAAEHVAKHADEYIAMIDFSYRQANTTALEKHGFNVCSIIGHADKFQPALSFLTRGNQVYVLVRGSSELVDWLTNMHGRAVQMADGYVHEGMKKAGHYVSIEVAKFMEKRCLDPDVTEVIFVGHSLGGAVGTVAAFELRLFNVRAFAIAFGAPAVFSGGEGLELMLRDIAVNFINQKDVIPRLTPEALVKLFGLEIQPGAHKWYPGGILIWMRTNSVEEVSKDALQALCASFLVVKHHLQDGYVKALNMMHGLFLRLYVEHHGMSPRANQ